jgi:hypothetical protein
MTKPPDGEHVLRGPPDKCSVMLTGGQLITLFALAYSERDDA